MRKNGDTCARFFLFIPERFLEISTSDLGDDIGKPKTNYIGVGIGRGLGLREIGRAL